jgi:multicomponent K+:H+ antiporter subunit D
MMALFNPDGLEVTSAPTTATWWFCALLLLSGLIAIVSLARAGIQQFWSPADSPPRRLKVVEVAPVIGLICAGAWLALSAERVLHYTRAAAQALHEPEAYIEAVLSAKPVAGTARQRADEDQAL